MSGYTNFTVETDADGIALVTWNMPDKSMNVFTVEVMDEIDAIVDQTVADAAVKGVVFTSGKSTFSGGADLSMIKAMFTHPGRAEEADPDNAAKKLFDADRPDELAVAQARNLRQAVGRGDQRHLHGRRHRIRHGLPCPRRLPIPSR